MIGETVEDYQIIEELGKGNLGRVYRATDLILDREVAVKVLHQHLIRDHSTLQGLRADALMLAKLFHPNIAMLYDSFEYKGSYLFVIEYIKGETFQSLLKQSGPFPVRQALELFCQVLWGFEHAHSKQVIHGGIKPANLILDSNGRVKITDFGIARLLGKDRLVGTERPIGQLQYMSPEQVRGLDTDERSDIYSLGVLLYEMVTGSVPFSSTSEYDLMRMQLEARPIMPRNFTSKLPESVEQAILCALEKDPMARFQTVREFRWVIEASLEELSIDQDLFSPEAKEKRVVVSTVPDQETVSTVSQSPVVDVTRAPALRRQRELLPIWATLISLFIVALVVFLARYLQPSTDLARKTVSKPPVAERTAPPIKTRDEKNSTAATESAPTTISDGRLRPQREIPRQVGPLVRIPRPPSFRGDELSRNTQIKKENQRRLPFSPASNRIIKPKGSAQIAELMNAAWNGRKGNLKDLLDEGVNVNARDAMGRTALMLAASQGHGDAVKFLLDRGASINARDISGKTALARAIDGGHDDTAKALVKRGAAVDAKYSNRLTSLLP